jgi:hypothetical protein
MCFDMRLERAVLKLERDNLVSINACLEEEVETLRSVKNGKK